ncbi:unnamed protein product [Boreogadus saida]
MVGPEDRAASDAYCMCGRIYKDAFISSGFIDHSSRDQACYWYGKAFEVEPSLHSGIHNVVLLMAAGHEFDTSIELRKIGVTLSSLLGRKGSLEQMQDYWDVGLYLGASILANDHKKVIEASEKLYRLDAPIWYVGSIMETYIIYRQFAKPPQLRPPKQDTVNFWMELHLQACKPTVSTDRCPVLILEPTKLLQPAVVSVSEEDQSRTLQLQHVTPLEKGLHRWSFPASSIRVVSVSKNDERSCFLFVHHNSDDFQLCFPTALHCKGFCELVNSLLQSALPPAPDHDRLTGEVLEYMYETTAEGEKVVLGKGTYGVVYAGRDLSNQVRIAIKEIPERDSSYSQPLHEEISLHRRLKHRNIVQYLGSASEAGFIKIFMEEVPGGSLSSLLRSKWGPLKDNEATVVFYTKQILQGLLYLHDNQIVHRDIKQGAARSADAADGSGRSAAGGAGVGSAVVGSGVESAAGESAAGGSAVGESVAGGSAAGESGAGSAAVAVAGESSAGSAAGGSSAGAAGAEAGADPGAVNVAAGATGSVPPLPYFEDVDLDSEEQSEPKKQQAPSAAENMSSSQSAGTEAASTSCTGRDPTVITNEGKGVSNSQASCEGEGMEYDSESDTVSSIGQEEQSRRRSRALWALLSLPWEQSGAESKCGPGARVCQPTKRQPDFMLDIAAVEAFHHRVSCRLPPAGGAVCLP